jgi:hypothetical protein
MPRAAIDLFVLDAIAFDADTYEAILEYLNDKVTGRQDEHGGPIHPVEVQTALLRLVRDGFVEVSLFESPTVGHVGCGERIWPPNRELAEMWFDLTGRGRVLYLNWDD